MFDAVFAQELAVFFLKSAAGLRHGGTTAEEGFWNRFQRRFVCVHSPWGVAAG
jgi:hypothetical protein